MMKSMFARSIQRPGTNNSHQQLSKIQPKNVFNSPSTRPHTSGMRPDRTFNEVHNADDNRQTIPTALRGEDSFNKECATEFDIFFIELLHSNPPSDNVSRLGQDTDSQDDDSDSDVDSIIVERRRRARRVESSQRQRRRQHQ